MRRTRGGGLWAATDEASGAYTAVASTGNGTIQEEPAGSVTADGVFIRATATAPLSA